MNKFRSDFLGLRNLAYTNAVRKFGEEYARKGYKLDLLIYFLSPYFFGLAILGLIQFKIQGGIHFSSEGEKSMWVLILSAITLFLMPIVGNRIYRWLVPPNEPLRILEGEEYKIYSRLMYLLVFGPMVIALIALPTIEYFF